MKKNRVRNLAIGIIMLCFGLFMCWDGYSAWQGGEVVSTKKSGSMRAGAAMAFGVGSAGLGLIWCWLELNRRPRKNDDDS